MSSSSPAPRGPIRSVSRVLANPRRGPGNSFGPQTFGPWTSMAADTTLALVFAGLLAVSAVILVFFPLLRHAWVFAATRIGFLLLVGPIIVLSLAALALVALRAANPLYLLPVVAVTVGLRVASPILLYRRVRDSLEQRRAWGLLRA